MFLEFQNGIEITEIKSVVPFGDPLAKKKIILFQTSLIQYEIPWCVLRFDDLMV